MGLNCLGDETCPTIGGPAAGTAVATGGTPAAATPPFGAVTLGFGAEATLLVQGLLVAPGFVFLVRSLYPVPEPVRA